MSDLASLVGGEIVDAFPSKHRDSLRVETPDGRELSVVFTTDGKLVVEEVPAHA